MKTHCIILPNGGRARVSSNISETGLAALCELTDALKRHMETQREEKEKGAPPDAPVLSADPELTSA